jgi:hypothetical protein
MGRICGHLLKALQAVADKCDSFDDTIEALTEWCCELKPHERSGASLMQTADAKCRRLSLVGLAHFHREITLIPYFRASLRR